MATKLSTDSFLAIVRQSGLVEESQIKKFWHNFEQSGKDGENLDLLAGELVSANLLSKWQIDKLLQGKHKGFFLGKYKLLSLLGSGGMSAVYLAEHTLMRRRVAIKVLPQSRIEDSSYLERFHREAQAVASLDHPNIMRAYDVDQEGKVHFLVMEYIEGQNFLELVAQHGPLNFVNSAEYIRQAAEGLSHAHEAGMIHRDIKPGNILVDKRGVVKILDMGLAMFFDPSGKDDTQASLTIQHDERVLGTADYLSPEQALNSHAVDVRTDIYSLGCTFYYILTGHPPFPEGSLAQRLLFHQTKQPSPVEKDRPDITPSLAGILRKMMEKSPANRFQTAKEVQDALSRWLLVHGDAEWREKNSMLVAAASSGSDIHGKNATTPPVAQIVHPVARPVTPPAAPPIAAPVVATPAAPVAAPVARPAAPVPPVTRAQAPAPAIAQGSVPSNSAPAAQPSPFNTADTAISGSAVATRVTPASADFGGFDPSEFTAARESGTTVTSSSSSTIKQGGRVVSAADQIKNLLQTRQGQMAVGGGALVLVLLLALAFFFSGGDSARKTNPKGRPKVAEYEVGGKSKYKTIGAALTALKEAGFPKTSIRVVGSKTYSERLPLSGLPQGVTIYAVEPGGPTLSADGPEPLLDISNVRGLNIEGFNLDASDKEIGIRLKGKLAQVGISGCQLTGFTKQGIVLEGAQGSSTDRVRLDKLHLKAAKADAVGILLTKGAAIPSHISVDSCRILGPMSAGIVIDTNCDDIELKKNILAETGVGIRIPGEARTLKELAIANTTFFKLKQGIVFATMPNKSSEKIGFFNNLFAQVEGPELLIEKNFDQSEFAGILDYQTARNWTDKPMIDPAMMIFITEGMAGVNYQFQSLDANNPGFLAPSPMSPQREAGPDGPYIGAIEPKDRAP